MDCLTLIIKAILVDQDIGTRIRAEYVKELDVEGRYEKRNSEMLSKGKTLK
jgi:hypothetical protein